MTALRTARTTAITLAISTAAALSIGSLYAVTVGVPVTAQGPQPTIEEDQPGWDCRTMGNRTCGPELTPADIYCTLNGDGIIVCPVDAQFDILYPVR